MMAATGYSPRAVVVPIFLVKAVHWRSGTVDPCQQLGMAGVEEEHPTRRGGPFSDVDRSGSGPRRTVIVVARATRCWAAVAGNRLTPMWASGGRGLVGVSLRCVLASTLRWCQCHDVANFSRQQAYGARLATICRGMVVTIGVCCCMEAQ
jgi:hypothetical protein